MTKYTGSWSANNSSTYAHGYESTNKRDLARRLRAITEGNVFAGNTGSWAVYEMIDGQRSDEPVMSGTVRN